MTSVQHIITERGCCNTRIPKHLQAMKEPAMSERKSNARVPTRQLQLAGKTFGQWTALRRDSTKNDSRYWWCKCQCGIEKPVRCDHLLSGKSVSCGCLRAQPVKVGDVYGWWTVIRADGRGNGGDKMWTCVCQCGRVRRVMGSSLLHGGSSCCPNCRKVTHGLSKQGIYSSHKRMLERCYNPRHPSYDAYGGRGIVVCERWRNSVEAFLEDMGDRPEGTSIDRIDNDGNYEPGNCRWATTKEQLRNTRRNRILEYRGKSQCVADWADELGLAQSLIRGRLNLGWSVEKALTEPVKETA